MALIHSSSQTRENETLRILNEDYTDTLQQIPDWEATPELADEVEEFHPVFAVTETVEHLPAGQVKGAEHLPNPGLAGVGGASPDWRSSPVPAAAGRVLQAQRSELVHADHSTVGEP